MRQNAKNESRFGERPLACISLVPLAACQLRPNMRIDDLYDLSWLILLKMSSADEDTQTVCAINGYIVFAIEIFSQLRLRK